LSNPRSARISRVGTTEEELATVTLPLDLSRSIAHPNLQQNDGIIPTPKQSDQNCPESIEMEIRGANQGGSGERRSNRLGPTLDTALYGASSFINQAFDSAV
jgi:hypothetical protein